MNAKKLPPDPEQLLRDVAEWWAYAAGVLQTMARTAGAICREAQRPESPLFTATDGQEWAAFAGSLQDTNVFNCVVRFPQNAPDPLRSLKK